MSGADTLLEVRGLEVIRGGSRVLKVSLFTLCPNETVALIGPNGTGKSSLLLALAGLLPLASGEIVFRHSAITAGRSLTEYRRKLSMVFQEPLLFDTTVYENVATGLKLRGLSKRQIRSQVTACLERFRIAHLADRSARKISGGEAQRTSLARAFATNPEVILLDEPFAALDPPSRQALSDDLENALRESGISAVMTTHEQQEALRLADRIVVMQQGEIIQNGSPAEIMAQPGSEFVATFVGMENVYAGTVSRTEEGLFEIDVAGRALYIAGTATVGEKTVICIHPEQITLSLSRDSAGSSARNVLGGSVTKVIRMGLYTKVYVDCGFKLVVSITNQSYDRMALTNGSPVYAFFKATAVHVFRRG